MSATDVVCDASVALKWFHSAMEEEVDSARALLDRYRERAIALDVLDLTPYEIGNALLRGGPSVGGRGAAGRGGAGAPRPPAARQRPWPAAERHPGGPELTTTARGSEFA